MLLQLLQHSGPSPLFLLLLGIKELRAGVSGVALEAATQAMQQRTV
jgi:hypothetical protein